MNRRHAAILLMLLCSACASAAGEAPACSGPRRPANPYGSVLAPTDKAPPPAATEGAAPPCGRLQ
jgi:hypothetical protein